MTPEVIARASDIVCELLPIEGEDIPLARRMANAQDRVELLGELAELDVPADWRDIETARLARIDDRMRSARRDGDAALALACEFVLCLPSALAPPTGSMGDRAVHALLAHCLPHAQDAERLRAEVADLRKQLEDARINSLEAQRQRERDYWGQ